MPAIGCEKGLGGLKRCVGDCAGEGGDDGLGGVPAPGPARDRVAALDGEEGVLPGTATAGSAMAGMDGAAMQR